jgi:bifunctional DNA-binding transcriptional regulator/antitoxin component of YhaV-PrlF toxin-antitoxin module
MSEQGQVVFPLKWRKQHGLAGGGEVRYATVGEALICYPLTPMKAAEAAAFVAKAGRPVAPPKDWQERLAAEIQASREARCR